MENEVSPFCVPSFTNDMKVRFSLGRMSEMIV
jgi:hypothetical protein